MITTYGEIPDALIAGIKKHVEEGLRVGGFLTAVLENDLATAVLRADVDSLRCLQALVCFVYNEIPSPAWGSRERVNQWRQSIAQLRESKNTRHLAVAS